MESLRATLGPGPLNAANGRGANARAGRRGPREGQTHHDQRSEGPEAGRLGGPELRAAGAGPSLGGRLHLLLDVVGLVLHRVRDRRLRPPDPGLGGLDHDDQPVRRRRGRAGDLGPPPRRSRPVEMRPSLHTTRLEDCTRGPATAGLRKLGVLLLDAPLEAPTPARNRSAPSPITRAVTGCTETRPCRRSLPGSAFDPSASECRSPTCTWSRRVHR